MQLLFILHQGVADPDPFSIRLHATFTFHVPMQLLFILHQRVADPGPFFYFGYVSECPNYCLDPVAMNSIYAVSGSNIWNLPINLLIIIPC